MKKKIFIVSVILVFCFLSVLFLSDDSSTDESNTIIENGVVTKIVTDDFYVEKVNSVKHSLYYCNTSDKTDKHLIESDKYIIKYSAYENFIAYHFNELTLNEAELKLYERTVNATVYNVLKDVFVIYDTDTKNKIEFRTQEEFIAYCQTNSLKLFDWKFASGIDFEKVELTDNCNLMRSKSASVPDQIVVDGKVVMEGYVSDYKVEENLISFRLQVPDKSLLEFPETSNAELNVGNTVVDKYFSGLVLIFPLFEDIYFDEVVKVDNFGKLVK